MNSLDIYSKTNPVLCSLIIWSFIQGYEDENDKGVEMPLIFIILPLIMTKKYRTSFKKTNKLTGFYKWIDNNPQVLNMLSDRLINMTQITKSALRFGVATSVFDFSKDGTIRHSFKGFKKKPQFKLDENNVAEMVVNSKRLGAWCGKIGNSREILERLKVIK